MTNVASHTANAASHMLTQLHSSHLVNVTTGRSPAPGDKPPVQGRPALSRWNRANGARAAESAPGLPLGVAGERLFQLVATQHTIRLPATALGWPLSLATRKCLAARATATAARPTKHTHRLAPSR